jgi:Protein of unknown function (DUF3592)
MRVEGGYKREAVHRMRCLPERRARTMNPYWIGILVVVGGGIVLALAIWGIKQFFQQDKSFQNQQDNILQNGVRVEGRIIEHRDNFSSLGRKLPYFVTYSYEYEGKTYTHEQEVSKKIYLASPDETKVSIHFLPDDPTHVVTNFDESIR